MSTVGAGSPGRQHAATAGSGSSAGRPRPYAWFVGFIFVVGVPAFLITTNVLAVTNDLGFYEREFARYRVGHVTGLTDSQLRTVAVAFIDFFAGRQEALDVRVELGGATRSLFNERELAHMDDVYDLMRGVEAIRLVSGLALLGATAAGFAFSRRRFLAPFSVACLLGGSITLAFLLALGGLALADFGDAFVQFHLVAFSNDLWVLDPRRDYLLMLFPEGFWFDATMRSATLTILQALAFVALGGILTVWRKL